MTTLKDFDTFEGKHCETTASKCLLLHEGVDLSEPMMLGLSQGFGFIYWKMNFMNLPFIGGRARPFDLTKVLCQNLGLVVDERQTTSKKKAWSNITEFIDHGIPVGLQLDCYHLEHFNVRFHFAGHFIAVYGYDDTHAYVYDTGNHYKVSLENLERSRFEKGSMAAKARSYTIKKSQETIPINTIIPRSLHAIAREFLNPPINNFGYKGIHKLGKEMVNWLEITPDPKNDLYDQALLMEDGGTGGAVFRNFFRDFLYESLDYLPGNSNIRKGADLYKKAATNGTEIANEIKKAGDTREKKYLEKASQRCIQTAEIEKEAMEYLYQI